jgi:hypothetical protein
MCTIRAAVAEVEREWALELGAEEPEQLHALLTHLATSSRADHRHYRDNAARRDRGKDSSRAIRSAHKATIPARLPE